MTLAAIPVMAQAQTFLGAAPGASNTASLRARALNNNTGDRVYVGLLGNLGTTTRDSYTGSWTGTGAVRDFRFSMSWNGTLLRFELDELLGLTTGSNNTPSVNSALNAGGIEYSNPGAFNAFRIFGRDASASLVDLTYNGVDVLTGTSANVANAAAYWTADPSSAFTVEGTLRTAVCSNDGCRFEIGVATTVVPEPSALALLLVGATGLGLLGLRRRRV
ncbi:MAG: PEP-CTERM sorting domain-containing protein [Gemmatimonadaceae bacterium]|nr:PEP-CTERM sorting domain-containing protein [Gemmatimonadaceae bacterium]